MAYLDIVNLIFSIITSIISVLGFYQVVFLLIGVFSRKKFKKSEKKHKYGIIICARNEEKVIANLLDSIKKNNYPQENLQVFVVAHNCTDKTAEIARENGASVYEYNNDNERTKGYALKYLFSQINKDYDIMQNDGYLMFDADNILRENYIEKMNDAFDYYGCKSVITSFRNSKNFNKNVISGLYGIHFMSGCRFESRGRTICGCSTRVPGTGFIIPAEALKNGWEYVTLTEDWEFSADQILHGRKIYYCDEAEFFDEQPTNVRVMFRQRLRWSRGHLLVFLTRAKALFLSLFKRKKKDKDGNPENTIKFSKYDIFVNILPFYVIATFLFIVQFVLCALAPLFQPIDVGAYWIGWLISTGKSLLSAYVVGMISAIVIFIAERKRIYGVSFMKKVAITLLWPIFIALWVPIDIVALFSKNLGWKTIPHNDNTSLEQIHEHINKGKKTVEETSPENTDTNESAETTISETETHDDPAEIETQTQDKPAENVTDNPKSKTKKSKQG